MIKNIYLILVIVMFIMAYSPGNAIVCLPLSAMFGAFFLQELSAGNRISKLNDSIDKLHFQMTINELLLVECREKLKIKEKKI